MRNCVDCDAATVVVPVNCSRLLCKLVVVQYWCPWFRTQAFFIEPYPDRKERFFSKRKELLSV